MFDDFLIKLATLAGTLIPAVIVDENINTLFNDTILFAGAITAAIIIYTKLIGPSIKAIKSLNDSIDSVKEAQVIAEDLKKFDAGRMKVLEEAVETANENRTILEKILEDLSKIKAVLSHHEEDIKEILEDKTAPAK